jgi:uncharacterized repeat protein (TIGR04138 family)
MQSVNFDEVISEILTRDPRYHRDAYLFLREALDHTQKQVNPARGSEPQHVTPQQLLDGFKKYALTQFGPMAKTVLNEWGVHTCEDVGELVFNMVDHSLLSKTETDSREGFKAGFDFEEEFCKPFRPKRSDGEAVPLPPQTKAGQA